VHLGIDGTGGLDGTAVGPGRAALAVVGSPSTPDGLAASTPVRTSSAIEGTGPATARSARTASGANASINDVST